MPCRLGGANIIITTNNNVDMLAGKTYLTESITQPVKILDRRLKYTDLNSGCALKQIILINTYYAFTRCIFLDDSNSDIAPFKPLWRTV